MRSGTSVATFLPNRLHFCSVRDGPPRNAPANSHWFSIDEQMVYWNFFLDFGPLNLGQFYRFCTLLKAKLASPALESKAIYFYTSTHFAHRANGAVLIGGFAILYLGQTPEQAWKLLSELPTFALFHDASPCACPFEVTVLDCLRGLAKARQFKFFDFDTFDLAEYEHFEAVENGDLNWIVQDKFFAFAGPQDRPDRSSGYHALAPEDYVSYFTRKNVGLIVRLNKPYYSKQKFTAMGADHVDLYYVDGSNPPSRILKKFLDTAENARGAIGVHCKAGLGRTGTCIGCYVMKHFKFTAPEIIAWMRICRPGSVIGPQQYFMQEMEQTLWREGDLFRKLKQQQTNSEAAALDASARRPRPIATSAEALSQSMGSLALAGSRSLGASSTPTRRSEETTSPTQGDTLRSRRQQSSPTSRF